MTTFEAISTTELTAVSGGHTRYINPKVGTKGCPTTDQYKTMKELMVPDGANRRGFEFGVVHADFHRCPSLASQGHPKRF